MLTQEDKLDILREFPNVKLPYEKIVHKKVYNFDLLLAIPDGKKCFAWLTTFKNKTICILLELDNKDKKEIRNVEIVSACFSSSLCYGTLFFGTQFYHMNNSFFAIEDICFYKGKDMCEYNFNYKINKIAHILKNEISQVSYNNSFIVFGLPLLCKSESEFEKKLSTISYKLSSIRYIKNNLHYMITNEDFNSSSKENNEVNIRLKNEVNYGSKNEVNYGSKNEVNYGLKNEVNNRVIGEKRMLSKQNKILICRADIQNDIYHLYGPDNDYIGLAAIPDYKTSVMMNKLFRNIKENNDLDALEESDDEYEFENSNVAKFVFLDKSYKMVCNFNHKFKKWIPIKIIE
jgi:hypothetical protein